ncbi:hypothetical protein M378DRAFT_167733 [Amanita muscaria Koide BX008]|uniref:Uncharacterized protein n=1 Tax=Amanita muscaria (strain Koide BX008) TaxID=946122 RepID=A0A0C2WH03_AMAMK|nr:hypothetical protein M378DRAFT_167733 [Amanita muscaria Koide BX008]
MSSVFKDKSKPDPGQKAGIEPPAIRVEERICIQGMWTRVHGYRRCYLSHSYGVLTSGIRSMTTIHSTQSAYQYITIYHIPCKKPHL